jgi:hypothetical protein
MSTKSKYTHDSAARKRFVLMANGRSRLKMLKYFERTHRPVFQEVMARAVANINSRQVGMMRTPYCTLLNKSQRKFGAVE